MLYRKFPEPPEPEHQTGTPDHGAPEPSETSPTAFLNMCLSLPNRAKEAIIEWLAGYIGTPGAERELSRPSYRRYVFWKLQYHPALMLVQ